MQILDVDLFIYKPRMNVKPILLVSKEDFSVILGLFQAGWQMIGSFTCRKACIWAEFVYRENFSVSTLLIKFFKTFHLKDITWAHESRNAPTFIKYPNFWVVETQQMVKKFKVLTILYNQGHGTFISKFS